jgi:hypothetical protein
MSKEMVTFSDLSVKVLSPSTIHYNQSTNLQIYTIYPFPVKSSAFHQEFHQPEREALDQNVSLTEN